MFSSALAVSHRPSPRVVSYSYPPRQLKASKVTFDDDGNEIIPDTDGATGTAATRSKDLELSSAAEIEKLKKEKEELHRRRLAAEKWFFVNTEILLKKQEEEQERQRVLLQEVVELQRKVRG